MSTENKELLPQTTEPQEKEELPATIPSSTADFLTNPNSFELLQRAAKMFAASQIVPDAYRGNVADCAIALMAAHRAGLDPLFFMQHSFPHRGKLGLDGQIAISLLRKRFRKVAFKHAGEGKTRSCTCYVCDNDGNEYSETVDMGMAARMGWLGSKSERMINFWEAIPDRMLAYRSASFLAKLYCPDMLSGAQFEDELIDTEGTQVIRPSKARELSERLTTNLKNT